MDEKALDAAGREISHLVINLKQTNPTVVAREVVSAYLAALLPSRPAPGASEWERDPLGHAVRLLHGVEVRYLAASKRERPKIAVELQAAKEEVVSVAVQLVIEKEAAKPSPAPSRPAEPTSEQDEIAREDREAVERIGQICALAGFANPDGTAVGAVRTVLAEVKRLQASAPLPSGEPTREAVATDASLRDCCADVIREAEGTVGERVAIGRLKYALSAVPPAGGPNWRDELYALAGLECLNEDGAKGDDQYSCNRECVTCQARREVERLSAVPEKPQEAVAWYVGVAKHPEDFGGFPRPEKVDVARGVWSFKGPTWICDCTDFQTANDMVEGHNRQLLSAASLPLDALSALYAHPVSPALVGDEADAELQRQEAEAANGSLDRIADILGVDRHERRIVLIEAVRRLAERPAPRLAEAEVNLAINTYDDAKARTAYNLRYNFSPAQVEEDKRNEEAARDALLALLGPAGVLAKEPAAVTDSERLDWIEENTGVAGYLIAEGKHHCSLRDAIDATRRSLAEERGNARGQEMR